MTDDHSELREIERAVLRQIDDGNDDTQRITSATTLETHQVRYSLKKLGEIGLVNLETPDGMVKRIVDGQKRVFQHPKQAELTENGREYLDRSNTEEVTKFRARSHAELVERVCELEEEVDDLKNSLNLFKKQIQGKI